MSNSQHVKTELPLLAILGGPGVALALVLATSTLSRSIAVANVALGLALLTTFVSSISWQGGLTTSITAAACLNFFHTDPVHSLQVTSGSDLAMIMLLMSLGFSSSYLTARRTRSALMAHHRESASALSTRLLNSSTAISLLDMWHHTVTINGPQLAFLDVRLEDATASEIPVIARSRIPVLYDDVVVLPETGAVARFLDPRQSRQILLIPQSGMGPVTVPRHILFHFVDQVELALTGTIEE